VSLTLIPMIAGFGEAAGELLDELARDLDITETLVDLEAISAGDVRGMLVRSQTYLLRTPLFEGNENERTTRLAELEGEIATLSGYDQAGPSPAALWPAERRAIERAYQWAEGNGAQIELDAAKAQARADVLNRLLGNAGDAAGYFGQGLEKTLQQAVKWLAIGVIVIGAVTVLPSVVGGLGSLRRGNR